MEQYVIEQIKYGLKYLPSNLLKSFFIPKTTAEIEHLKTQIGGFICGVCHPSENYKQILDANIRWVRFDIPAPFDSEGNIRESYEEFKRNCKAYQDEGIKVMAVTPYPYNYIEQGLDPRTQEDKLREVSTFLINDLQEYVNALQVTNEMGLPHFTLPLTLDEAARFIGVQLEVFQPLKRDIIIGYNSAGPQADLHLKMKPYFRYCDYIGIDIYIGCFAGLGGFMWFFDAMLRYLYAFTGKPILLQEFGYIGMGDAKNKREKVEVLKKYGVSSIKEAYENIESFVSKLPQRMQDHIAKVSPNVGHQGDFIFKSDFVNHLFCELPGRTKIPGYPHTPEGQAKFFEKLIPHLYKTGYVCGAFIYCYSDGKACYICSQEECPTETKWGLVDVNGKEKPSYYAVQKVFGKIIGK